MTVNGGLDYEVVAPSISTPGSYFAGVTVIGLSSGGLPGVAVLGETPFSVVGSANTASLPTFLAPPSQFGCYSTSKAASHVGKNNPEQLQPKKSRWTKAPCLSKAQVAQLPPPLEGDGIGILGLNMMKHSIGAAVVQVQFSQFTSERDTAYSADAYSVQLNTNKFFGKNSHMDWVQFVLQKFSPPIDAGVLCVWVIDIDAGPDYHTNTVCMTVVFPGPEYNPEWGNWGFPDFLEIDGIAYPAGNAILQGGAAGLVVQFTSSALPGVWYTVAAPDAFGLTLSTDPVCCSWSGVDGTILGLGAGSQAIFTSPTKEQTLLYAQYYPPGQTGVVLTGSADISLRATTAESNNLDYINPPTNLRGPEICSDYAGGSCSIYTNSGN
jgi:hypothetical protein